MRLWTWQRQGFSLTDEGSKVDSLKYSVYLNGSAEEYADIFKKTYKKLWGKLGTDQFHWYCADEDEAKDFADSENNVVLWEVEIPDEAIFRRVCSIAWNHLLGRQLVPKRLKDYWQSEAPASQLSEIIAERTSEFAEFWKGKSEDQLWGMLFLNTCVEGCTQVLVQHPLDESWVVKNPEEEGRWWNAPEGNRYDPGPYVDALPCRNCLGRV